NEDESSRLRQLNVVENLKINLNSLMARDLSEEFDVEPSVEYDDSLLYDDLLDKARKYNPDLQIISINKRISELQLKQTKSNRYPVVQLNTGYNFSESESSLGFVSSSNSRGLNYGITASVNIFDGFNQRRNERIGQIQVKNADLMIQQQDLFVKTAMS